MRPAFAIISALVWCAFATSFAAAYEDKITLGIGPGYALLPSTAVSPHGIAFDAHAGLGVTEAWQVRAGLTYAHHPGAAPINVGILRSELLYLIDIVEIVPHAGIGIDALVLTDARTNARAELAAHAVLGAAYWLSFDSLLELQARLLVRPAQIESDPLYLVTTLSFVFAFDR